MRAHFAGSLAGFELRALGTLIRIFARFKLACLAKVTTTLVHLVGVRAETYPVVAVLILH